MGRFTPPPPQWTYPTDTQSVDISQDRASSLLKGQGGREPTPDEVRATALQGRADAAEQAAETPEGEDGAAYDYSQHTNDELRAMLTARVEAGWETIPTFTSANKAELISLLEGNDVDQADEYAPEGV